MIRLRLILLVFLFLAVSTAGFSQSKDDEKRAKQGQDHFDKKEFLIAEKFFSQLLAAYPENSDYNCKYGACLLSTAEDKKTALKYLKFATENGGTVGEAHYYYGKALQYNYRFKEALVNYNSFRSAITNAKINKYEVDALIKQCKTSIILIEEYRPVQVVSAKKMARKRFEKAYRLGKMSRKILVKPNDFKTKEDFNVALVGKKFDPQLIVHGQEQNTLFFSGYKYGKRFGILEKDIYMVEKSHDGIWTNFMDVGPFINSEFDEDYPYLHPNGRELYFSSKGHGGLGGYDIFKSQLDSTTGLWGRPINLGFPVNSAFDDVLYINDSTNNVAYFSSNRATSSAEMMVYKIIPNSKIDNFVILMGEIIVEGGTSNEVSIEVVDAEGLLVGEYLSNKKTGAFSFPLAELEIYRLKFSYNNEVTKSIKLVTPLKSNQAAIFKDITFKVNDLPSLEAVTRKDYIIAEDERIASFQTLSNLNINQKTDTEFGAPIASSMNGREDTTVKDPELLLRDAVLEIDEIKQEKKELSYQINAGYVLTHENTKKGVKANQDLKGLTTSADSRSPKMQEEIKGKQQEYDESMKLLVDAVLFIENQEQLILQKDKEVAVAYHYVEQINEARLGVDIDLVEYRKKMAATLNKLPAKDKIVTVSKEIKNLKNKRSTVKNDQFNLKSEIDLLKDAVEFLTTQMNKTKDSEERLSYAEQITSLEKVKKKKIPVSTKNKLKLAELDSLMKLKAIELSQYGLIDAQSTQSSMKRVNLNERELIAENVKKTVNQSKYAGKLDLFEVKNVMIDPDLLTSTSDSQPTDEDFEPSDKDLQAFLSYNLNDASDQQVHQLSTKIFGVKQVIDGEFEDVQINKNDQVAANDFREALMMKQEIEKKKKLLAEATAENVKKSLREEIKILEDHLSKMEFEAMVALSKSNDLRKKEKNVTIELSFLLNPGIQIGEIAQLYNEANEESDEVTMLKQRLANNNSPEQKANIAKEILNKQLSLISKLVKIERLINRQPTDISETIVDSDVKTDKNEDEGEETSNATSTISFGSGTTKKPDNPPINNFGRNGIKNNTNNDTESTFNGGDINEYGTNSTMRIKKGILLTSNIKYNINTKVPIDIPLGTGVIYKVQIGAFRNKINPEMFNGITPLSAEDAGNGVYRYTAGIFKSLTGANMAKGKIVEIGFSDAFVVAFFNGQRILLTKAENVINSSTESQQQVYQKQKADELAALKKAGIKESDAYIAKSSRKNPINKYKSLNVPNPSRKGTSNSSSTAFLNNENKPSKGASRSTNATGVYYTVQIGVFSSKKTSSDLHGISPLVTHINERGLIRYSTGIFKSFEQANERKAEARAQGAEDAYVAVYRDGVRISTEEAQGN
jgi:hypothetical protein